ncbi:hypothetical protein E4U58_001294 [Claviceps cyperi]|nr:hypothetical protein E4U58_001294 [Claviceps cyperi]
MPPDVEQPEEVAKESADASKDETEDESSKHTEAAIATGVVTGVAVAGGAALAAAHLSHDKPEGLKEPSSRELPSESKATEEEEGKDTLGPIPSEEKVTKSKKGEERLSFSDTPSEQTENLVAPITQSEVGSRAPTPDVVIPDAVMIEQHRAASLRRKQKLIVRGVEDTLAAADITYATAEALSPPASPRAGNSQDGEEGVPPRAGRETLDQNANQLHTNLSAEESSRRHQASSDGEERRRRHRQSSHSSYQSARSFGSREEEEPRDSKRRSSHGSQSRTYRPASAEDAVPKTPPRTLRRHDSSFSGESAGSAGKKKHRTPDEQAEHARSERSGKSERSAQKAHRSRETDSPTDSKSHHRSSRRTSHSSQKKSERVSSPHETEKRFFDVKNAEGIVGSGMAPQIAGETTIEVPVEASPSSTRSRHGLRRTSTNHSRATSHKSGGTAEDAGKKGSEDKARKVRQDERNKKLHEEQKPSGIRGIFRRIFG